MIFVDREGESTPDPHALDQITYRQALVIGLFQCFALWPGMSRSGSTIIGGMFVGLRRVVAAEFSFLVAVPVMCAAVAYDMLKSASSLGFDDLSIFGVGFVVSFLTAIVAIRFFMKILAKLKLGVFGYYRITLGALVLFFMS